MAAPALEKSVKTTHRPRILIVDDDPGVLSGMRLILDRDYDVTEAQSIEQSLAAFDRQTPDLITLDVRMPGVDGMQGLDVFRHRSEKIPIILISGYHTFELARQALRLGANDYLPKPFTVEELLRTIKTTLAKVHLDENSGLNLVNPAGDFRVRVPLQDLQEGKFLSTQHRNYFLNFAQNVLSDKKPAFETIALHELIKTIDLQFHALHLVGNFSCEMTASNPTAHLTCDMYLLGGALANLAVTCMVETRSNKALLALIFDVSGKELRIRYKKSDLALPESLRGRFEDWHRHGNTSLDVDAAMLALAEKVVELHQGKLIPNSPAGCLLEISLRLK